VKPRRLVDKVKGEPRRPAGDVLVGSEPGPAEAYGITVDVDPVGYHGGQPVRFQLDGQPPVATTKGWGRVPGT